MDTQGNVTSYQVDLNRMVTEMTQKNGGKYSYTYDAVHRLTGITTPLGYERSFTYDVGDKVIRERELVGILWRIIMFKNFNALEELYVKSQAKEELEYIDLLGNVTKYTFNWNPPIEPEKPKTLIDKYQLKLPKEYNNFLLKANGAILYNNIEGAGYKLLSLEEAIDLTKEMREVGYSLTDEWFIFMLPLFSSDMLLFDLSKVNSNKYIIDGIAGIPTDEWKLIYGDFRIFMNQLFICNGAEYWRW